MKPSELAFFTDDVRGMTAFYRTLLGREPEFQSNELSIFDQQGIKVLIHFKYLPGPGDLPAENHIAFSAPDLDAACAQLAAAGLKVEIAARDYDWGRSAYLRDPEGHLIEIQQGSS